VAEVLRQLHGSKMVCTIQVQVESGGSSGEGKPRRRVRWRWSRRLSQREWAGGWKQRFSSTLVGIRELLREQMGTKKDSPELDRAWVP